LGFGHNYLRGKKVLLRFKETGLSQETPDGVEYRIELRQLYHLPGKRMALDTSGSSARIYHFQLPKHFLIFILDKGAFFR
jgi:hypothetical protein